MRKKFASTLALAGFLLLGAGPVQAASHTGGPATGGATVKEASSLEARDTNAAVGAKAAGEKAVGAKTQTDYSYYPGGANAEEFWFCTNPFNTGNCLKANAAADDALSKAQEKFSQDSLYQGKGDAYRHCYWNARMTIELGAADAQGFADRHESESPEGEDKDMDLRNNETGRQVGEQTGDVQAASDQCESLAVQGKLVTLK